jgi:hypothetical protein
MTEADWLAATNPDALFDFLGHKLTDRKARLFSVACCRRIWELMSEERCRRLVEVGVPLGCKDLPSLSLRSLRNAVEAAERAADEPGNPARLQVIADAAFAFQYASQYYAACYTESWGPVDHDLMATGSAAIAASAAATASAQYFGHRGAALQAARAVARYRGSLDWGEVDPQERVAQCVLVREIFGNPFRPVVVLPEWRTEVVVGIATTAYAERSYEGLPILADALVDAGCDEELILGHCLGNDPHTRGCWVLDLLLDRK